uniref:Uncharacterized protein n=1 Tax=Gopherus evgoodei TaxID=1825980 RepID=A0A8C4W4N4_9SAUR
MSAEVRLKQLEALALDRSFLGLDTLLDLLLCVSHELGASPLAHEKYIAEFLRWASNPGLSRACCPVSVRRSQGVKRGLPGQDHWLALRALGGEWGLVVRGGGWEPGLCSATAHSQVPSPLCDLLSLQWQ